jgi:predicted RNA-binding protein
VDSKQSSELEGIMTKKYWLDLFTGKSWEEFLKNGAKVSGFSESRRNIAQKIHPGDYFICYLTGLSRFIGVSEVVSDCYESTERIWEDDIYPIRFDVRLVYQLTAKTAVPIHNIKDKLSFFRDTKSTKGWSGFFRGSLTTFPPQDAEVVVEAIKDASKNPIEREYDEKSYFRRSKVYKSIIGPVTIPEEEKDEFGTPKVQVEKITHEEMQWLLLKLGSDLGLDVWVARNDGNKEFGGNSFQALPKLRKELPRQFDEATSKTIELIDVLWLQKDAIVAAFEVEHTSTIYSGLLRMSDLVSMQPNIRINLYIVAPDERRDKVIAEVNRPTFARLSPPLPKVCKFIPYSELKKEIGIVGHRARYMKPQFIDDIAENCEPDEA